MWMDCTEIPQMGYSNIFRPINPYVHHFGIKPEMYMENEKLIIVQKTHAEIWVERRAFEAIYALDKCWQRQFYPSDLSPKELDDECLPAIYKFYTQWILDEDVEVAISEVESSPFKIITNQIKFEKINKEEKLLDSSWVEFMFKKTNDLVKNEYDIIEIGTPMYKIEVSDNKVIERILSEK